MLFSHFVNIVIIHYGISFKTAVVPGRGKNKYKKAFFNYIYYYANMNDTKPSNL